MQNYVVDERGRTCVVNAGGPNGPDIKVPVCPPGQYGAKDRVAEVKMKSGAVHIFGGENLATALKNGGTIIRVLQEGKQ